MEKKRLRNQFIIEQLEPRLLFSADFEPIPFDGGLPDENVLDGSSVVEAHLIPNASESVEVVDAEHKRHEVMFIDAAVPDYQQLVDDLLARHGDGRWVEVVVLDSSRDGIEQISETLNKYQDLDAVHVLSHGTDGAVQLGNTWLTKDTIDAYTDSIEGWRGALTDEADLLFYGCDLAAGEEGRALIDNLTFLTGADVAASDDPTGSAQFGGDWVLEYSGGKIESTVAFSQEVQQNWQGSLAAPTISTPGPAVNYNENDPATIIDATATVTDPDSPDFNGGTLTVSFSAGGTTNDELSIVEGGGVSLNAPNVKVNGSVIASYSGGTGGTPLVITWTNNQATPAAAQAVLRQIGYRNTSGTPDTTPRTIDFVTTDGDGGTSNTAQQTIITNDPPTATYLSAGETYTEDTPLNLTDIVVTDVDSANVTVTLTLSDIAAGSLSTGTSGAVTSTFVGGVWTASGAIADVNTLLAGVTFNPALNYNSNFTIDTSVDDGVAPAITGTKNMTGTPQNDAPVNTVPGAQSVDENITLVFSSGNGNLISVSDVDVGGADLEVTLSMDNGTLTLAQTTGLTFTIGDGTADATMIFTGTATDINAALDGMGYTPTAEWSGSATLTLTTSDQGNTGNEALDSDANITHKYTFDVDGTDDIGSNDTTLNNGAAVVADGERGNVVDTDGFNDYVSIPAAATNSLSQFSFSFWVKTTENGSSGNPALRPTLFGTRTDGLGSGDFRINTNKGYIAMYTGLPSSGGDNSYTSATTQINDNQWHQVTISNDGSNVSLYVDGNFEASLETGKSLDNMAFLLGALNDSGTPSYYHQGRFDDLRIFDRDLTAQEVSDLYDKTDTDTVAITVNAVNDAPVITSDGGGATASVNAAENQTAVTTVTATDADVPADTLTYTVMGGADSALFIINGSTGVLTFNAARDFENPTDANVDGVYEVTVQVDDGNGGTDTQTISVTVTDQNDAPVITNLNAGETYTEDTPLNLTDIVVTDVDSANVTVTLTLSDIAAGSLSTGTSGAVTSTFVGGVWTASGAIADVNTLLAGVTFNPALNYNSNFTIDTSVDDGVAPAITGTKSMTGTLQNDAPVGVPTITGTVTEDQILTADTSGISDADGLGAFSYQWLRDGVAIGGATASTYTLGDADVGTQISVEVSYTDGQGTAEGPLTSAQTEAVANINDAPTATNLSSAEIYIENIPLNLTDIVVSDVDSANVTVTLTLSDVTAGSLSTATSGAVTSTFVGGVWTASGAIADVNALLAGVTFNPALNYNSNFTIATSVDDGVAAAITGVKNITGTAANNSPTATNLSAGETYTEDTPLNLIDIVVTDVDGDPVTVTLILSDVAAGSLSTGTSGAVTSTYNTGTGVWTASGAIADINALLAGVTFNPSSNYDSNFTIATSVDDGVAEAITGTKNMSSTAVGDTPQVGNIITLQGTQSDLIIIDRNVNDSAEVTSFRISGITNGTLYQADGVTQINDGDYITYAQAQAGVRFTPAPGSITDGSFDVESSEDGVTVAVQSGTDTSTITVTPAVSTENIDPEPDPTDIPGDDVDNVDDPETETEPIDNPLSGPLKGKSLIPKPSAFVSGFDQAIENSGDFGGTSSLGELDWEYNEDYDVNALMINEGEDVSNITSDFYNSIESSIEMLRNSIESIERQDEIIIKAVKGVTLTLSVGLATWVLRTGSLVASAITSIPIWKSFDPLPVLPLSKKKRREKINEVRIIEKDERMKNKKVADLLDGAEGDEVGNAKEEDES